MAEKIDLALVVPGVTLYGQYRGVTYKALVVSEPAPDPGGQPTERTRLGYKLDRNAVAGAGVRYSLERAGKDACGAAHLDGRSFWSLSPPAKREPQQRQADNDPSPRAPRRSAAQTRMIEEMKTERVQPSGTDDFMCAECGQIFSSIDACLNHLDTAHPGNEENEGHEDGAAAGREMAAAAATVGAE